MAGTSRVARVFDSLLPDNVERRRAFHANLGVSVRPHLVIRVGVVGLERIGVGELHTHAVLARSTRHFGSYRLAGAQLLRPFGIELWQTKHTEGSLQLAVPDFGEPLDLLRERVAGLIESVPVGGSGLFDRRPGETVHEGLLTRVGSRGEQKCGKQW